MSTCRTTVPLEKITFTICGSLSSANRSMKTREEEGRFEAVKTELPRKQGTVPKNVRQVPMSLPGYDVIVMMSLSLYFNHCLRFLGENRTPSDVKGTAA